MENLKLRAWGDNVLLKKEKKEPTSTKSGILMGHDRRIELARGEVLHIGQGTLLPNGQLIPIDLEIGDRVVFHSDIENKLTEDGEEYCIVSRKAIIGFYNDK